MVDTLARKNNRETLLDSRRGKSVTRAVQVRMGCRVEEYVIPHISQKAQMCLPGLKGNEGPGL